MKHIKLFENFDEIVEDIVGNIEQQETLEVLETETKEVTKVLNFVDFMGK